MAITGYKLIDTKTKTVIQTYAANKGQVARNRMDRLDNQYGAYRYSVKPIFSEDNLKENK